MCWGIVLDVNKQESHLRIHPAAAVSSHAINEVLAVLANLNLPILFLRHTLVLHLALKPSEVMLV